MAEQYVLVIGLAGLDIKAYSSAPLGWNQTVSGEIRNNVSGVARNIAENLARLEIEPVLLSAVGKDSPGRRVIHESKERGIVVNHVRLLDEGRTSQSMSIMKADGEPGYTISDYAIMAAVDSNYLWKHEPLFAKAALVVIDATLSEEALATVFELADRYTLRVCADPTLPSLAGKLCDYLPQLYMIAPNAAETTALCGLPNPATTRDNAIDAARQLVTMGVQIAVITLGAQGVAYADGSGSGFIRAVHTHVVDPTGAGDAFSAAVIFGLLNDVTVDEAMRLGITAASLTLQSRETVLPSLSQELLYDKLVV